MYSKKASFITQSAIIAALYVAMTYLTFSVSLASGPIQIRFSEALAILPYFTPAAIPGLFIGCLLSNALTGAVVWDVIFGSLATLLGALITYALRKTNCKWIVCIPNILANTIIVPLVLIYAYGEQSSYYLLFALVAFGEIISCGVMGTTLLFCLDKYKHVIFKNRG